MKRVEYLLWAISFSWGGKTLADKYKSFGLAIAMWHPFVDKKIINRFLAFCFGTRITFSHKFMKGEKMICSVNKLIH
jgi:hypothetical protein